MKKTISIFSLLIILSTSLSAQVAPGFNFQGVARNAEGDPIVEQSIDVVVGIKSGSASGSLVWEEEHTTSTNEFGLFTLKVCGDNSLRSSGTAATVDDIDWAAANHYIDLQVNTGQGLLALGASQILSVPYSMVASSYPNSVAEMSVQPQSPVEQGEALFMVKREDGYPVFAVYEDGVWVYTDDDAEGKGIKGGFAVGGYNSASKRPGSEYFMISPDSARIYVNSYEGKGIKGGFAIGGYNSANKGPVDEFMRVTRDSTRIYVESDPAKGIKGGFAVGGYKSANKAGENGSFMSLQKENYFIGHNSGANIDGGIYNSVMGYESGINITTGESNAFLGYQAGYLNNVGSGNLFLGYQTGFTNSWGNYNTFLGYQAGYLNWGGTNNTFMGSFSGHNNAGGSYNTYVGDSAGYHSSYGGHNTFVGTKAGLNNTTGYSNVFIGNDAGSENDNGYENVYIGRQSGYKGSTASRNVFIGVESGFSDSLGWDNILIGTTAGKSIIDGAGNVVLGYQAGFENVHGNRNVLIGNMAGYYEKGSGKLHISNMDTDSTGSLIWGDFYSKQLRLNANVGIGMNPGWTPLSIYHPTDIGSISIQGAGNAYDYSAIYLSSDTVGTMKSYTLSHTKTASFFLGYNDGINVYPRMLINSAGHVSLNNWEEGSEVLDVNGNARFRGVGNAGSANDLRISADGTLTTSTSDARLKSDIQPLLNSLEKVMHMDGYTFTWKDDDEQGRDAGLIAQDVAEIFPEAVFENPNDGYMGINYSRFPALFVEAFKEQQTLIEDQQEEIESQQTEIDDLKARLEKLETLILAK